MTSQTIPGQIIKQTSLRRMCFTCMSYYPSDTDGFGECWSKQRWNYTWTGKVMITKDNDKCKFYKPIKD